MGRAADGTGGLLILYTNEFLNNGIISSNGSNGATANTSTGTYRHGTARRWRLWTVVV